MQNEIRKKISPSLICADFDNIRAEIEEMKKSGIEMIHTDIIDGKFSPGIPLTYEQLDRLAPEIDIPMDFHIMSENNEKDIMRALKYNAKQICFHYETARHADRYLGLIKSAGVKCGIALNPLTPVSVLEYAAYICDYVLLMLINPGYASQKGEMMVSYAERKIADTRKFLNGYNRHIPIEVDGRVSIEAIPKLKAAGADIFVGGSTSVFRKGSSISENCEMIEKAIESGAVKNV